MSVAAKQKGKRGELAVDYLQRVLSRFERMADAAWKSRDPVLFTKYSKTCIEIATSLATYQTPRLSAVATIAPQQRGSIDFELKIFDKQRVPGQPVQIEAKPIADPAAEVIEAVAFEPPAPEESKPAEPEAPPPPTPPLSATWPFDDGPTWRRERSLLEHPSMMPLMRCSWRN
jgi:hypothetical protein